MKQKLTLKLKILLILLVCLSSMSWAQTPDKPYFESSTSISLTQLKTVFSGINFRRGRTVGADPLQDKEDYRLMLEFLDADGTIAIHNDIKRWLKKIDFTDKAKTKDIAIVLIAHPIDHKRLFATDLKDQKKFDAHEKSRKDACKALNDEKKFLVELKKQAKLKQAAYTQLKATKDIKEAQLAKALSSLNQINATIASTMTEVAVLTTAYEKELTDYLNYYDQIIENKEKTNHTILSMEKENWSEYLLNKREVLFVIIGGKDDIANSKISVENKPSSFQNSFNELKDLSQQLGVAGLGKALDAMDNCDNPTQINQSIPIKFMLTKPDKIKSPTTITIAEEKSKLDLKLENHELAYMGLKVGVSAAYLERKQFTLDASNNLTIKPDTSQVKEWKSNLMVMLDFYPFGRDIDRLEPIWKKNRGMGLIDPNRFGVSLGLKLSKDPLETSFLGLSYAISKELSINGGFSFNATPKDVTNLPVGVNATLDYLKNNAKRELTTSYFFGISLSPGIMSKTLGLIK